MDLQNCLDESGYTQAAKELEEARAALAFAKANLEAGIQPNIPLTQFLADLVQLELQLDEAEKALAVEYAATVKQVDAANDLDLVILDMEERAELVLEHLEKDRPDSEITAQVRDVVEKMRRKDD